MISAHDWIHNSAIDQTIWDRWPDYRVWLVATDGVDAARVTATADDLFHQATASATTDDVDDHVLRWNWRQTSRTAIDPDTRRLGFIIDSLDAPDHHGARRAANQLAEILGTAPVRTIDATGGGSC